MQTPFPTLRGLIALALLRRRSLTPSEQRCLQAARRDPCRPPEASAPASQRQAHPLWRLPWVRSGTSHIMHKFRDLSRKGAKIDFERLVKEMRSPLSPRLPATSFHRLLFSSWACISPITPPLLTTLLQCRISLANIRSRFFFDSPSISYHLSFSQRWSFPPSSSF